MARTYLRALRGQHYTPTNIEVSAMLGFVIELGGLFGIPISNGAPLLHQHRQLPITCFIRVGEPNIERPFFGVAFCFSLFLCWLSPPASGHALIHTSKESTCRQTKF